MAEEEAARAAEDEARMATLAPFMPYYPNAMKIVVLGQDGAGKSSLVLRFCCGRFVVCYAYDMQIDNPNNYACIVRSIMTPPSKTSTVIASLLMATQSFWTFWTQLPMRSIAVCGQSA